MSEDKICPLMSFQNMSAAGGESPTPCIKEQCQWWAGSYTVENRTIYDCALVILAMKDSSGMIQP